VQDTGPGIAPEPALHVFDLYYRVPGSPAGGLGFGLATVKRLVEAHGGTAGLSSRPGEGCTFWFTLPHAGVPEPLDDDVPRVLAGRPFWRPALDPPRNRRGGGS